MATSRVRLNSAGQLSLSLIWDGDCSEKFPTLYGLKLSSTSLKRQRREILDHLTVLVLRQREYLATLSMIFARGTIGSRATSPSTLMDIHVQMEMMEKALDLLSSTNPELSGPLGSSQCLKPLEALALLELSLCMQYIQQSLLRELIPELERGRFTAGQLNFTDQSVNSKLALESSKSGFYATIDLSDASDRVHKDCVYRMLRSVPHLRNAVFACRSHSASLPDGTIVPLNKFASMGSALCFPMESMMFFTLCVSARLLRLNLRPTSRNIFKMSRDVYIYGDDIIIPVDEVPETIKLFEAFSLKVNVRKTFYTGKFRESCGMDAYNGVNVTPVYVRSMPPDSLRDASAMVSFVSLANQLFSVGLWGTARFVRELVESHAGFELPFIRDTASCLGWINTRSAYSYSRLSKNTQAPEVRSLVVRASEQSDPLSGYPALMKFFLKVGDKPIQGKHLERTVRPGSANIKIRWAQPF